MILVKFTFKENGAEKEFYYTDEAQVTSHATAEEEIKKLIAKFNKEETRRYAKRARHREFVKFLNVGEVDE